MSTKKERMYEQIEKHGANLNLIFDTGLDNITLSKKLRSLEVRAHRLAEMLCSENMSVEYYEAEEKEIKTALDRLLGYKNKGIPVFFNGDPRGHALKIHFDYMDKIESNLERDLGGYGLLAPEFTGN